MGEYTNAGERVESAVDACCLTFIATAYLQTKVGARDICLYHSRKKKERGYNNRGAIGKCRPNKRNKKREEGNGREKRKLLH